MFTVGIVVTLLNKSCTIHACYAQIPVPCFSHLFKFFSFARYPSVLHQIRGRRSLFVICFSSIWWLPCVLMFSFKVTQTPVFLSDCQDESHDSAVLQESEWSATCENLLTGSRVYFMLLKYLYLFCVLGNVLAVPRSHPPADSACWGRIVCWREGLPHSCGER